MKSVKRLMESGYWAFVVCRASNVAGFTIETRRTMRKGPSSVDNATQEHLGERFRNEVLHSI